jgi:2-iminobutanoate/2-iminopropanoate deaminase
MATVVIPLRRAVPGGVPESAAMKHGDLIFTAGLGPVDPETGEVKLASFEEEARMTLDELRSVLDAAGSSLDRVIKITVYLQDMRDYLAWNEIYAQYFHPPYPARACIQAANMPFDVRVQIDAVAHV